MEHFGVRPEAQQRVADLETILLLGKLAADLEQKAGAIYRHLASKAEVSYQEIHNLFNAPKDHMLLLHSHSEDLLEIIRLNEDGSITEVDANGREYLEETITGYSGKRAFIGDRLILRDDENILWVHNTYHQTRAK